MQSLDENIDLYLKSDLSQLKELDAIFLIDLELKKYKSRIFIDNHKEFQSSFISTMNRAVSVFTDDKIEQLIIEMDTHNIIFRKLSSNSSRVLMILSKKSFPIGKLIIVTKAALQKVENDGR